VTTKESFTSTRRSGKAMTGSTEIKRVPTRKRKGSRRETSTAGIESSVQCVNDRKTTVRKEFLAMKEPLRQDDRSRRTTLTPTSPPTRWQFERRRNTFHGHTFSVEDARMRHSVSNRSSARPAATRNVLFN